MAQEKSRKRLPEEEGGDTQATYAYCAAEAGAKYQGKEPIGQVLLCCSLPFWSSICQGRVRRLTILYTLNLLERHPAYLIFLGVWAFQQDTEPGRFCQRGAALQYSEA